MTRRTIGTVLASLLLFAACGSESSSESEPAEATGTTATTATTSTVPEVVPEPTQAPAEAPAPTEPPAVEALMPNVVCMNLQDAQDLIQEAGVFFSRSVDASGDDRNQWIDSNWLVLSQEPEPGTPIEELEALLAVVKYGEPGSEGCG